MAIGVVAAVAVIVGGAVLFGRRRSTDTHSVRGYHETLATLEHLQGRSRHDPEASLRSPPRSQPARHRDPSRPPSRPMGPPSVRRTQRSLAAMNHEPRRWGAPMLVLVVLAAIVGAIAYVGVHSHNHSPASTPTTQSDGSAAGTHHHHTTGTSTTTTTTTLPARYTAVSTTTSSATYAPTAASYTLTAGATSGSCWLTVTEANGTTMLSQTLTSGSTRSLAISGKATILIGAPSVASLKIDNVPIVLPPGAQAPFTVTLVPAS